ncbi:hypothetical protein [Actimicrobium sp. CCI2.3]|uniref:hypothetical protein n=1 Tax=Actimicrobium sp. CCI2.3 TaxID=3048616 RepID=UPI002AB38963|nr:hypothetical protein [Actimicrobium sp. CCI2.3]MDY7573715.1 hypothetical protein [Actimicrobium sp. CCI2.3]MEB0021013.1 hypothetical protein [Actimicrobium sp. CCI2.3]
MRTSKFLPCFILCVAASAAPLLAQAQTSNQAPPQLERLEEGSGPDITIKPRERSTTTQTREQGVVTEVQVQSGGSNYRVKQGAGPGNAMPGDAQSNAVRAPQWLVKEFDWGSKKEPKSVEPLPMQEAPPPPLPTAK